MLRVNRRNDLDPASPARQEFYARIGALHLAPLWEVLGALVPPVPSSPVAAAGGATTSCVRSSWRQAA